MAAAASASSSSSAAAAPAADASVPIPAVERSSVASIASRYRGQALVHRLSYLAEVDSSQRAEALALALVTAKECGKNAAQVMSLSEAAGVDPDAKWLEDTTKHVDARAVTLERELNMRLAAQDRDGIMEAHTKLGQHYALIGEGDNAISSFLRAREYCTPAQLVENTLSAVRAGLHWDKLDHIETLARQALGAASHVSKADRGFLQAAVGLVRLRRLNIDAAAQAFLACGDHLGSAHADAIHNDDVAIGATLCAIASLDRAAGKRKTQESLRFRRSVAPVPDAALLAESWAMGDFGTAVRCLDAMTPSLRCDAVFGPALTALRTGALDRIVIDATSPFSRSSLDTLSARLTIPRDDLTATVVRLIEAGRLPARLDAAAGVLVARYSEQRPAVFARAMALAASMERETKAALLCASMKEHGYAVRPAKQPKGQHGGMFDGVIKGFLG